MNEIATPFIVVFLSDYIDINFDELTLSPNFNKLTKEELMNVESDTYWCFSKFLEKINDNFTAD